MNENDYTPAPLGKPVVFGNPWHGEVRNAVLTLPDSTTKTVPITPNDGHGACWVFRVPGAPGSAGADAPPGGEWRDYLLGYARGNVVYQKLVNSNPINWLCMGNDGSRWMLSVTSSVTGIAMGNASLALNFFAERFGEFGVSPETYNFTLTLPNRGLSHPTATLPTSVNLGFSDATENGQKAVLLFYTAGADDFAHQRMPYGFAEVVLNPDDFASSTISLLYNTESVSGILAGFTYDVTAPPTGPDCEYSITLNGTPQAPEWKAENAILSVWYDSAGALKTVFYSFKIPLTAWTYSQFNFDTVNVPSNCDDCTGDALEVVNQTITIDGFILPISVERHGVSTMTDFGNEVGTTTTQIEIGEIYSRNAVYGAGFGCDIGIKRFLALSDHSYINIQCTKIPFDEMHPWIGPFEQKAESLPASQAAAWNDEPLIFVRVLSPTLIVMGLMWDDSGTTRIKLFRAITKFGHLAINQEFAGVSRSDIMGCIHPVTGQIIFATDGVPVFFS